VDLGGGVKMDLVWVPAGTFWMGSNLFGDDDEKPAHSVRISQGFWMGRTEVMQRQWERIMGNNPSYFKGFFKGSHPVESVSWNDCQEFIRKLNRQVSGGGFRLPTEAEWEYACQAGTTGDYAGDLDAMGWYSSNSRKKTHPVGRKQPNAWWLYDMHGNVWEWCDDAKRSYTSTSQTDPRGSFGSSRVLRGGSWNYESGYCRSTYRTDCDPTYAGSHIGFRVVFSSPRDAVNEPETTSDRRGETRIQTKFTAVSGERPTAGTDWTSPSTGMEFVWVEEMGLWVGKYEVTNGEYRKKEPRHDSKEYEGHSLDGPRQPVVYVNFDDAKAYADWLTQRDREELNGMRYRVPSEDEWMKFAQCDRDWEYPWGNNWPPRSRQAGNYHGQEGAGFWSKISGYNDGHPVTCNVEEIWANPWGLYGVGGNVWECCAVDKSGRSFGAWRGASWGNNLQDYMRCSYRFSYGGSFRGDYYGFRLVLSPQ
jgi:formylglycine-generating enzyme required for sulfatase activity